MNNVSTGLLTVLFAFATGCVSSTSYQPWSGPSEFKGTGGTVRNVDGIQFWENGEPAQPYRLLGIVDHAFIGDSLPSVLYGGFSSEKRIAKEARKQGGDAVILLGQSSRMTQANSGYLVDQQKRVAVIKYLDSSSGSGSRHQPIQNQEQAFVLQWTQEDLDSLREAIRQANTNQIVNLGTKFFTTEVSRFDAETLHLFSLTAMQGHAPSQYVVGLAYDQGKGAAQDSRMSFEWLRKAAENGYGPAQMAVGAALLRGTGVPQNVKQGLKWLEKAAQGGNQELQVLLVIIYSHAEVIPSKDRDSFKMKSIRDGVTMESLWEGVERDYVRAYTWLSIVAKEATTEALIVFRALLEEKMSPEEIAVAKRQAAAISFIMRSR